MTVSNGKIVYEGGHLGTKKHGKGKEYYPSKGKLKFEGEYLYGSKIKGKLYNYIDGKLKYEGEFRYDRIWNGKGYDKKGNIKYEFINGIRNILS